VDRLRADVAFPEAKPVSAAQQAPAAPNPAGASRLQARARIHCFHVRQQHART
jgi:hypothetical protein